MGHCRVEFLLKKLWAIEFKGAILDYLLPIVTLLFDLIWHWQSRFCFCECVCAKGEGVLHLRGEVLVQI